MILRPEQIKLLRAGRPLTMANGGSDSESDSSQTTTTNTTNNVNEQDRRIVASDAAIAVSGGGSITKTDTNNFTDNSNRSSSTTTNYTTTDFGAVTKSLEGMGQMGTQVVNFSNDAVRGAIDSLNRTGQVQLDSLHSVFDFAAKSSANALTTANQVLGFAQQSEQKVREAWADAKQGPEQKIMLAIVGAAAVVAVTFALKGH